jgi:hypothetical protein
VGDQDQDADWDLVAEIREENEEDSNAMMEEHFPEFGLFPFIDDVVEEGVEMPSELHLIEKHSVGEVGDFRGIFIDISALAGTSEVSWEEEGIIEKNIGHNACESVVDDIAQPGSALLGSLSLVLFSGVLDGIHLGLQPGSEELKADMLIYKEYHGGDDGELEVVNGELLDAGKVGVVVEVVDEVESVDTIDDEAVEEGLENNFPAFELNDLLQDEVDIKYAFLLGLGHLVFRDRFRVLHTRGVKKFW